MADLEAYLKRIEVLTQKSGFTQDESADWAELQNSTVILLKLVRKYREALNDTTSVLFLECQPGNGHIFASADDVIREALAYDPRDAK